MMKNIKLALLTLPLLIGCGGGSSTYDTGWVYLKDNEVIRIYLHEKEVISRENNQYYSNVCYRYTTNVIDLKYRSYELDYRMTFYGSGFSLIHMPR